MMMPTECKQLFTGKSQTFTMLQLSHFVNEKSFDFCFSVLSCICFLPFYFLNFFSFFILFFIFVYFLIHMSTHMYI